VKRDNAEDQQARIAPELDRHRIGWLGLAMGPLVPLVHSDMPKGRSSMAGFVSAMRQRSCLWGEVRLRCPSKARGVCSGQPGIEARSVWCNQVQSTRSVVFGDVEGQRGWLAGLAW